ncbi:MAG: radical SAM protein [bacterium]
MPIIEIKSEFAKRWHARRKSQLDAERDEVTRRVLARDPQRGMLTLDIEPTNECNLRCVMCARTVFGYGQKATTPIGFMDMTTYCRIIDEASALGVMSLRLAWYGEPLLHPHIGEMVRYAKGRGIGDVGLNTNATCLDRPKAIELVESGLDRLMFSVDSPYPEQFEQIRKGAHFDTVIESIRQFRHIRDEHHAENLLTRATMVVMKENAACFDDYVLLLAEYVDVVATSGFHDFSVSREGGKSQATAKFACPYLWISMVIGWDGRAFACTIDAERNMSMGDACHQGLSDIWRSNAYEHLRGLHASGQWEDVPLCRKCNLVSLFLGVAAEQAATTTGPRPP